jgi:hypothetical protein
MSRRAKKQKQQTDRAPLSGTRISNERGRQRKQQRRKSKPALVVVPSQVSDSAPPTSLAAAAAGPAMVAPAPAPASLPLPVANPGADCLLADEALADVELSFFEGASLPVPVASDVAAEPSPLEADEDDCMLLTPEQQQRRQWFRRQVTALMAGMSALGTAAIVVRIASLL